MIEVARARKAVMGYVKLACWELLDEIPDALSTELDPGGVLS